jgi:hypothetical protein
MTRDEGVGREWAEILIHVEENREETKEWDEE